MNKLLAISIASASIAIGAIPALAEVDAKTHKLCLEAKDYLGCVKAMTGKTSSETVIRQIQQQGANVTEGNSCPEQHIYSGGGYCQRVICVKRGLFGKGHDKLLADKGISCNGGAELTWDNNHQPIRASFSKKCPNYEPEIGYSSTCAEAQHKGYVKVLSLGYKRDKTGFIEDVIKDSPADDAGVKIGDKIISVDGTPIRIYKSGQLTKVGEEVTLVIMHEGKRRKIVLTAREIKIPIEKSAQ